MVTAPGALAELTDALRAQQPYFSTAALAQYSLTNKLYEADLKFVMPLTEADLALGGVTAKAWVDPRSVAARLGSAATPTAATDAVMSLAEATSRYPRVAHAMRRVQDTLVLRAETDPGFDVSGEATKALQTQLSSAFDALPEASVAEAERDRAAFTKAMNEWVEAQAE